MSLKNSKGFTLIELMVVLVIIGIFAAIAAPSLRNSSSNQALSNTASDLQAAANLAKNTAITRNTRTAVAPIGGNWANGWQVFVDGNGDGVYAAAEDELLHTSPALPDGIVTDTVANGQKCQAISQIAYGSDGFLAQIGTGNRNGGVQFSSSVTNATRCVMVSAVGRVRVCGGAEPC